MKLTYQETARICRGLSLLLHSGISLADGLYLLAGEEEKKEPLERMASAMDEGAFLSQAMAEAEAFPGHAAGLTSVGEKTGRLEEALSSLADFYDQRERTARLLKSALAYPCMLLVLMLIVVGVLLIRVLPVFDRVYASFGSGLTGAAGGLLRLGALLKAALPGLLVLLVLAGGFALAAVRRPALREKLSKWFYTRFGDRWILKKFNNARFAQALAMALGSGLNLEEGMALAEELLAEAPQAAQRCRSCAAAFSTGKSLAQALAEAELLPPSESRILSVGLRSGSGDRCMADIAQRLMEDAESSLEESLSRVEPALVMVCSVLVGGIILSVMLPLSGILANLG